LFIFFITNQAKLVGNLSFSDIQSAIDFYEEDLRFNNHNIHMDFLNNEFAFWKQKWSNEDITYQKIHYSD